MRQFPFELPVYFMDENDVQLQEMGLPETPIEDCPTVMATFFSIDCVMPSFTPSGIEICDITSGGTRFLVPMTYQQLREFLLTPTVKGVKQ